MLIVKIQHPLSERRTAVRVPLSVTERVSSSATLRLLSNPMKLVTQRDSNLNPSTQHFGMTIHFWRSFLAAFTSVILYKES